MHKFILTFFPERDKLKGKSLYHLLKGKRSASILLFGYFQQLLPYLGMYPQLTETDFAKGLRQLKSEGSLTGTDELLALTDQGREERAAFLTVNDLQELDFFHFGRSDLAAWRYLKLAVQVVSQLNAQETDYLPLETNLFLLQQLKHWLAQRSRQRTIAGVRQELTAVFQTMSASAADFLANQFSGWQHDGLTSYQLFPQGEPAQQFLYERQAIHGFLKRVLQQQGLLYELLAPLLEKNQNQSMLTTQRLVMEGLDRQQIQQARQLAQGTIQDHLLEWAIQDPQFPFERFLTEVSLGSLAGIELPAKDWRYREQAYPAGIDYFDFRLAQIRQFRKEVEQDGL